MMEPILWASLMNTALTDPNVKWFYLISSRAGWPIGTQPVVTEPSCASCVGWNYPTVSLISQPSHPKIDRIFHHESGSRIFLDSLSQLRVLSSPPVPRQVQRSSPVAPIDHFKKSEVCGCLWDLCECYGSQQSQSKNLKCDRHTGISQPGGLWVEQCHCAWPLSH